MIDIKILFYILLIHFLADFVLQTSEQAVKKSHDFGHLTYHVLTYSLVWLLASGMLFDRFIHMLAFCLITYYLHLATDFVTSKLSSHFFKKKDFHNGFVIVGADQLLHYIQLILTYQYLNS